MSVPTSIKSVILKKSPIGLPTLDFDKEDSTFEFKTSNFDKDSLKDGEVLVKVLYLSNDPAQRGWINNLRDPGRTYSEPVKDGEPVRAIVAGEVVLSKSEKYKVGDLTTAIASWSDYVVLHESKLFSKIDPSLGIETPVYLGALGLTGLTAYFGLTEVAKIQKGQSILVSTAAGATGSLVVQLAKNVFGASKVIGIAGTDAKNRWVESIGADVSVNYHDSDYKEQLSKIIGTDYVDTYVDFVGGEILDFALSKVKKFGTIVAVGSISGYNDKSKGAIYDWSQIVGNSLKVEGFVVINYFDKVPEAIAALIKAGKEGKVDITGGYHVEDVSKSKEPLLEVPAVWGKLFGSPDHNGKLVTKIA